MRNLRKFPPNAFSQLEAHRLNADLRSPVLQRVSQRHFIRRSLVTYLLSRNSPEVSNNGQVVC